MTMHQVGVNAAAIRTAATRVERIGYTGDAVAFVEALITSVLADGYRTIEPPPPLRPAHVATAEQQAGHAAQIRQTLAEVRDGKKGTT